MTFDSVWREFLRALPVLVILGAGLGFYVDHSVAEEVRKHAAGNAHSVTHQVADKNAKAISELTTLLKLQSQAYERDRETVTEAAANAKANRETLIRIETKLEALNP